MGDMLDINMDCDTTDNNNVLKPTIDITVNTSGDGEEEEMDEYDEEDTSGSSEDSLCINCTQRISDRDSHNCEGKWLFSIWSWRRLFKCYLYR